MICEWNPEGCFLESKARSRRLPMSALVLGAWLAVSIVGGVCAAKRDLEGIDYFLLSRLSPF